MKDMIQAVEVSPTMDIQIDALHPDTSKITFPVCYDQHQTQLHNHKTFSAISWKESQKAATDIYKPDITTHICYSSS